MENKTYKQPKIPKITPIKDLEGRDGQAVTDHVICFLVIHVLYCVSKQSVHPSKGFDAVLETDFPRGFLNDIPFQYFKQIVAPLAFA